MVQVSHRRRAERGAARDGVVRRHHPRQRRLVCAGPVARCALCRQARHAPAGHPVLCWCAPGHARRPSYRHGLRHGPQAAPRHRRGRRRAPDAARGHGDERTRAPPSQAPAQRRAVLAQPRREPPQPAQRSHRGRARGARFQDRDRRLLAHYRRAGRRRLRHRLRLAAQRHAPRARGGIYYPRARCRRLPRFPAPLSHARRQFIDRRSGAAPAPRCRRRPLLARQSPLPDFAHRGGSWLPQLARRAVRKRRREVRPHLPVPPAAARHEPGGRDHPQPIGQGARPAGAQAGGGAHRAAAVGGAARQ